MNASLSEDSVAETALAKKNSDGKHRKSPVSVNRFNELEFLLNILEEGSINLKHNMLAM